MLWTYVVLWNKNIWEILSSQKLCERRNNFRQHDVQFVFITVCVCGMHGYKHGDRKFDNFMKQVIWLLLFHMRKLRHREAESIAMVTKF